MDRGAEQSQGTRKSWSPYADVREMIPVTLELCNRPPIAAWRVLFVQSADNCKRGTVHCMTIPLTNWTERTPKETFRNGRMDPFLADTGCTHGWKKWNWHTCAPSVRCWGHCKYGELQSGNRLPKVWNGSVAETGQYFLNVQPDIK